MPTDLLAAGGQRRRLAILRLGSWLAGLLTFVLVVWLVGTAAGPEPWGFPK